QRIRELLADPIDQRLHEPGLVPEVVRGEPRAVAGSLAHLGHRHSLGTLARHDLHRRREQARRSLFTPLRLRAANGYRTGSGFGHILTVCSINKTLCFEDDLSPRRRPWHSPTHSRTIPPAMHFEIPEDHRMIKDLVGRFVRDELLP